MKLYKIIKMVGDHGVSVFPPEEEELPPPEDFAAPPWGDYITVMKHLGFTDAQAEKAVIAWAHFAKYKLHQGPDGVRRFVSMSLRQIAQQEVPPPPQFWALIALVAAIAAVALGLFLWMYLDQELNLTFRAHKWAYVMSYQERLWQGEILFVTAKQVGAYERGAEFGDVISGHDRDFEGVFGRDWIWIKPGRIVLEGRRVLFYHVYRIHGFYGFFCGVLTHLGAERYRLREGGRDGFKPTGLWLRPGGRWGTPEYEGCWQEWWWF